MQYKDRPTRLAFMRKRSALRRKECKEYVQAYLLTHPCIKCGEDDPIVLDFHHRDPKKKTKGVARLAATSTLDQVKVEIAKCDVLCANDHRRQHHKDTQCCKELYVQSTE
jgi:hypothetical protein